MNFEQDVFDMMPNKDGVHFNFKGIKMPTNKDVFFRAKQKETLDKYQAARRFMYELDTQDWNHYFQPSESEKANQYFKNVLRAQLYEAALMFYNTVVDLSWIACYISAEYAIYEEGKGFETDKITSIEDAYMMLRKAEGIVQTPHADDSFTYLKRECPEFAEPIDHIIEFWKMFSETEIRHNYNYLKHKGALCYEEIQKLEPGHLFNFFCNNTKCPIDIRDIQKIVNLEKSQIASASWTPRTVKIC